MKIEFLATPSVDPIYKSQNSIIFSAFDWELFFFEPFLFSQNFSIEAEFRPKAFIFPIQIIMPHLKRRNISGEDISMRMRQVWPCQKFSDPGPVAPQNVDKVQEIFDDFLPN